MVGNGQLKGEVMIADFNLLATTSRGNENAACSELKYLLEKIGDPAPRVVKSGITGIVVAKSCTCPIDAVKMLRASLYKRPYEFRYLLRIIPIERIVSTDLKEFEKVAEEFGSKIGESETYRVTVEKRFNATHTSDIIKTIASRIERKVDLQKPDKILLVEVIGRLTGISILASSDILSIAKEKAL